MELPDPPKLFIYVFSLWRHVSIAKSSIRIIRVNYHSYLEKIYLFKYSHFSEKGVGRYILFFSVESNAAPNTQVCKCRVLKNLFYSEIKGCNVLLVNPYNYWIHMNWTVITRRVRCSIPHAETEEEVGEYCFFDRATEIVEGDKSDCAK